ncbi:hypothetical protein T492DRAFT_1068174 [Pavlovales sp. CCMP2436]|nr:hypothetical protein T492DRAFT_1068174 [Pavlovales sp. CCMP2436]
MLPASKPRRGADLIGSITGASKSLTRTLAQAGPIHERRGPESTNGGSIAVSLGSSLGKVKIKAGACSNCGNDNPALMETDYKNGNYVCRACGVVDPNRVLSAEEESRVFADDTAADKAQKKRAEYRADGGLGSYIAGGAERRGQLPNPAVQSLQRAQLRVQEAPAEMIAASQPRADGSVAPPVPVKRDGTGKQLERYKMEIDKLGEKEQLGDAIKDEAKRLADRWASQVSEHDRCCKEGECRMRKAPRPKAADAAAGAFLQRASSRSTEGAAATRALQEFDKHIADRSRRKSMHDFWKALDAVLKWDKKVGCAKKPVPFDAAAAVALAAAAGGLLAGGGAVGGLPSSDTAKGLVSRALQGLCADKRAVSTQIEQYTFGLLDWISQEALLMGRQPKTVAAAALVLACQELLRAGAPVMSEIDEVPTVKTVASSLGEVAHSTVQAAIDAIRARREAFTAAQAAAAAGGQ